MYVLGRTDPTLTMGSHQQVLDVSAPDTEKNLKRLLGCTLREGFEILAGRGIWTPNGHRGEKCPPPVSIRSLRKARSPVVVRVTRKRLMGLEPTTFCWQAVRDGPIPSIYAGSARNHDKESHSRRQAR
jgi:hypothetical protein